MTIYEKAIVPKLLVVCFGNVAVSSRMRRVIRVTVLFVLYTFVFFHTFIEHVFVPFFLFFTYIERLNSAKRQLYSLIAR